MIAFGTKSIIIITFAGAFGWMPVSVRQAGCSIQHHEHGMDPGSIEGAAFLKLTFHRHNESLHLLPYDNPTVNLKNHRFLGVLLNQLLERNGATLT